MRPLTGERNEPVDAPTAEAATRASDQDRDEVLVRLHTAYAEGRLDEGELDERIDLVLAARTHAELDRLARDLPAAREASSVQPEEATSRRSGGRLQLAWKGRIRRSGRWRLPERYTVVAYKSDCLLDLRSADLAGPVSTLRLLSYKADARIIVPSGVRVEVSGMGVSSEIAGDPSPNAPVIHVQGYAYKGAIEVMDHLRAS
jgi:hypothetical protein